MLFLIMLARVVVGHGGEWEVLLPHVPGEITAPGDVISKHTALQLVLVHVLKRMLLIELLVLMPMTRTPIQVAVEAAIWARDPRRWYD